NLDGGGFTACTSPRALAGLSEGAHTFEVRAVDQATNKDGSPASYSWTVDLTPPDTSITSNPPQFTNSTTATFNFTGTDNISAPANLTFQCKLDAGSFAACTSPTVLNALTEGSHTFQVRAIDQATNVDPTVAGYTWIVDLTPP